jgi:RNA polymerase sigma-70 factor (ECF subfamily)
VRPDPQARAEPGGDLLGRVADGDVEAFAVLYHRYAHPIFGLALRRLRHRGRAEHATEDAFAAIWRAAGTFDTARDSRVQWLFTIARSSILGQSRSAAPSQWDADDAWLAFRVHAALGDLPEPERIALELSYWSGRSRAEIAELLGIPLELVEARTRAALARLVVLLDRVG